MSTKTMRLSSSSTTASSGARAFRINKTPTLPVVSGTRPTRTGRALSTGLGSLIVSGATVAYVQFAAPMHPRAAVRAMAPEASQYVRRAHPSSDAETQATLTFDDPVPYIPPLATFRVDLEIQGVGQGSPCFYPEDLDLDEM